MDDYKVVEERVIPPSMEMAELEMRVGQCRVMGYTARIENGKLYADGRAISYIVRSQSSQISA